MDALPADQKRELADMLLTSMSHRAILAHMREEWGVKSSAPALTRFYQSFCGPLVAERRRAAVTLAESVAAEMQASPVMWDELTIDTLRQLAFRFANNPEADPKDIKSILSLMLKARDQDLSARRVRLMEDAQREAKERLQKIVRTSGGLSEEALRQIEEAANLL